MKLRDVVVRVRREEHDPLHTVEHAEHRMHEAVSAQTGPYTIAQPETVPAGHRLGHRTHRASEQLPLVISQNTARKSFLLPLLIVTLQK